MVTMHESDLASLLGKEIQRLEDKYLRCSACPTERHCCHAQGDYTINFTKRELMIVFGNDFDNFSGINCIKEKNGRFQLANASCLRLTESNLCSIHDEKESLGLKTCLEFPFKICPEGFVSKDKIEIEGPLLIVQYRCYAIEGNWTLLVNELVELEKEFDLNIHVIYNEHDNTVGVMLKDFEILRGAGEIGSQHMYTR
jgi:hypothetical protein